MKEAFSHTPQDYHRFSDEDLVRRYVDKRADEAIKELYRRYAHLVLGVAMKYLKDVPSAQDATQQVFMKLLGDLPRFEIKTFKPWLHQVARNHCLMLLRQRPKEIYQEEIHVGSMELEEDVHHKEAEEIKYTQMEAAMGKLNTEQRECLELFYYQKKNYAEIAAEKNLSLLKVKSALQNGKRNLKIILSKSQT